MAELYSVSGSTIAIGGVLASKATDFVAGDFASQTWTNIDGWESAGSVGDTADVIKTNLINRDRVLKQKGSNDAGSMENNFAIIDADPGQVALIAASKTDSNYAFKVTWNGGDVQYFIGLVTEAPRAGGTSNTVQMLKAKIEINSNVVDA